MNKRILIVFLILVSFIVGFFIGGLKPDKPALKRTSGDSYPNLWYDAPYNSMVDSWANGNRGCTSWVSFKVFETYGYSTYRWGGGTEWIPSAISHQIKIGNDAKVGSVAVDDSFSPGHLMFVEQVNNDGTIKVSEYNYTPGVYSERTIEAIQYKYLYFNELPNKWEE